MDRVSQGPTLRFGVFELDTESERLLKGGHVVPMQPQPFKLLRLLASHAGHLVTREQIRLALWTGDTFVDFEQGVNFAIKQVRDALGEDASHPLYIETVPKRGYRFVAPVEVSSHDAAIYPPGTDPNLRKALWTNIAELRLAEARRQKRRSVLFTALLVAALAALVALTLARMQ